MSRLYGLMGAMDEEIELLLAAMTEASKTVKAGITYTTGIIHGQRVVVCKSGVGKVNAAVTTQILIDHFGVEQIIFTGVAGAVHPDLNIGDIVISSTCMQHDMDVTPLGYARGVIPYQDTSEFVADSELVSLAEQACKSFGDRYIVGKVLSGDQFVANRELVTALHQEMDGACTEMEGAAVAQTAHMNAVPYVVLRSMSDKADGSAHVNYAEFTVEASHRSHRIVEFMLKHLS
ncbi:5'-methylthioadenosine/adenosylhomocysteine nucleosidase [Paenibacillus polymyxa]|uniref:5'-methylthioadenosine/adenosylhomocysteine nucleosidase n=1 Tax=Paenibacillus polymyxa TaxID=1406 RepID=UPI002AB36394|nr:5'-methylthioadenosine/adenosylhomocysteine nucleosidase [Paenibacillus polymyxa]MDY8021647.1 5'-methylthioadenosine/adenosylhomocysteine nucleosidase [Paenibacillus polymyxa]